MQIEGTAHLTDCDETQDCKGPHDLHIVRIVRARTLFTNAGVPQDQPHQVEEFCVRGHKDAVEKAAMVQRERLDLLNEELGDLGRVLNAFGALVSCPDPRDPSVCSLILDQAEVEMMDRRERQVAQKQKREEKERLIKSFVRIPASQLP